MGPGADPSPRGLEPDQTARARRDTDGAAAVRTMGHRHDAGRHRRRSATAGTSGGPVQVPWRPRRWCDIGLGVAGQPELRCRGLADHHCSGPAEQGGHTVVDRGDRPGQRSATGAHRYAGDHRQVLDRARDAEKWRQVTGREHGPLRRPGLLTAQFRSQGDERADPLAEPGGALHGVVEYVRGRDLTPPDRCSQFQGRQVVDLGHGPDRRGTRKRIVPSAVPPR